MATFEHRRGCGALGRIRSYKEVVDPLRLPAHDWRICGLNVNRVNGEADSGGPELTGVAAAPATPA